MFFSLILSSPREKRAVGQVEERDNFAFTIACFVTWLMTCFKVYSYLNYICVYIYTPKKSQRTCFLESNQFHIWGVDCKMFVSPTVKLSDFIPNFQIIFFVFISDVKFHWRNLLHWFSVSFYFSHLEEFGSPKWVFWEKMFGRAFHLCSLKQSDLATTDSPKLT